MLIMATLQQQHCSSSCVTFFVTLVAVLLVVPTSSTSRGSSLLHHQQPHHHHQAGFRVALRHVDSGKNLTKLERVQHGIKRGKTRLQRLNAMVLAATTTEDSSSQQLEAPIHAGNGEYLMELSIGTPPESYPAVLDTGSDLIWTQCKPCSQCYKQPTPIFDPKKSSTFSKLSCSSNLCSALPSSTCSSDGCNYVYSYGDYSMTQGVLATETFTFGDDKVSIKNIGFGCGEDNEGDGFEQASGLVGLGRGPLSLVSQLKEPKFSYCLTPMGDSKTSLLLLGSLANTKEDSNSLTITTPLLTNPSQPSFYYLSLEGISVGDTRLSIEKSTFEVSDDGSGGVIIDSGTTITYIEENAFDALKKEFISQTKLPLDKSGTTGLDVCFTLPSGDTTQVEIPKLVFHFKGGDLELPAENYMIADSGLGVACLAMGASNGMSIFGNVQQQNILVNHDLQKGTISFVPTQCDQL